MLGTSIRDRIVYHRGFRGALYKAIRSRIGATQVQFAGMLGISRGNVNYREKDKMMYTIEELSALRRLSGLEWSDMGTLIDAIVDGK